MMSPADLIWPESDLAPMIGIKNTGESEPGQLFPRSHKVERIQVW